MLLLVLAAVLGIGSLASSAQAAQTHLFQSTFNASDAPKGQLAPLQAPLGLIVDDSGTATDGRVYVSDTTGHSVVDVFDSSGHFLFQFDGSETVPGFFSFPWGLAVDQSNGDVYVADINNGVVDKFDATGKVLKAFGDEGLVSGADTPQASLHPAAVAVDPKTADLYVADYNSAVIDVFNSKGEYQRQFGSNGGDLGLAIDSQGNLFAANGSATAVYTIATGELNTSYGAGTGVLDSAGSLGVAVDPATDDVYVADNDHISFYDKTGALISSFGSGKVSGAFNVGIGDTAAKVYSANRNTANVTIFGPSVTPPDVTTGSPTNLAPRSVTLNGHADLAGGAEVTGCEFEYGTDTNYFSGKLACEPSPPLSSPTTVHADLSGLDPVSTYHYRVAVSNAFGIAYGEDREFTTPPSAPLLKALSASDVRSDVATLHAQINPGGGETKYRFEFATEQEFEETAAYGGKAPIPDGDAGSGIKYQSVSVLLADLESSTTYHWRLVATNSTETTYGPDLTFTTFESGGVINDGCPNAHVRQQTSAALLPDCRAYELVSAASSGGYDVESNLVAGQEPFGGFPDASSPAGVLYGIHSGAIPGLSGDPTNKGVDPYVATRGEEGWTTRYVGVPAANPFSAEPFSSRPSSVDAGLSTFAFGAPGGCAPCFADGSTGIPVRLADGTLIQGMAGSLDPGPGAEPDGFIAKELSADGAHLLFGSTSQFEPDANNGGDVSIYDRNLHTGITHVVSKTPAGANLPCLQGAGACHSPANGDGIAALDISEDGSRIIVAQRVSTDPNGTAYWHLYMNIDDAPETIDLTPGATDGVLYDGMTADGSKVFFTTEDQLTGGSDADSSADVYQAEVSGSTATLSRVSTGIEGTGNTDSCEPVSNIVHAHWNTIGSGADCGAVAIGGAGGVAFDEGTIYFLSPETLDGAGSGVDNAPNLYVARPGVPPHYVATLESTLTGSQPPLTFHRFLGNFGATPSPAFMAIDHSGGPSDGDLYVSDRAGGGRIYKFDPSSGALVTSWGTEGHLDNPRPGFNIGGLAVGPSGTLYIQGGNCEIFEFDPNANPIAHHGGPCSGPIVVDSSGTLNSGGGSAIAVDPSNDDFYFDGGGGTVLRSASGGPAKAFASGLGAIKALAVDAAHNVYVDEGTRVVELDPTGAEFGVPTGAGLLSNSSGLALDSAGNLFVGNPGRGTISEFGPSEPDPLPQVVSPIVADAVGSPSARHTADFQVSPDGEFAVFPSVLSLTGMLTGDRSEVYRYDAAARSLACVSCDSTGVVPTGDSTLAADGSSLTDDGRVFFNSDQPLVERDSNRRGDVYEWEAPGTVTAQGSYSCGNPHGCLGLITTGTSAFDSALLGAVSDGADVHFFSRDKLVAQGETGRFVKLYDARELGGFPIVPTPVPCKASDECHGPGSPIPPPPDIHLNTGATGNVPGPRCKRGSHKKHGKCSRKSHVKRGHRHKRRPTHG